jgi:N4-gp56 family major capsid protein
MAITTTDSTLNIQKWRRDFWREYQRENLFAPYMGDGQDAVIHRIYELKDEGESITYPLVGRLKGAGQTGSATLAGNEEAMDQYGHKISIDWARHAVLLNKKEQRKSAIDQLKVVRPALMDWGMSKLRDDLVYGLANVGTVGISTGQINGVTFASATAGQRNTWVSDNSDRVLFGATTANYSATFATAAGNVNNTAGAGKLSVSAVKLLKRLAKKADPHIRPLRVESGREYFVLFTGSNAFRDISADSEMINANKDARAREGSAMDKNPLFQDGDLLINGVIIREVPEIDTLAVLTAMGASSINLAPVFLCGQQALGYAVGQLPAPTERKEDDYGFVKGRGVETCYGVAKIQKKLNGAATLKDWGVATGFFACVDG